MASVGVRAGLHTTAPPTIPLLWSALVSGVLGGLLYAALSRAVARPILWLWIITLALATVDSVLIATLPLPAGRSSRPGIPIVGLLVPLRQLAALVGIGELGEHHVPAASMLANTLIHYVTAVAVALLVPWRFRGRGR